MRKLLLATQNQGKIREILACIKGLEINPILLSDLPPVSSIEETGASFEENAFIKAAALAKKFNMAALADDSGLIVPALHGEPGIFSSRYGADLKFLPNENRDQRNIRKLLLKLADKKGDERKAYFKTVVAVVMPNGAKLFATGEWHGKLLAKPAGNNGFGYDPVFFDEEIQKSAAEMSGEEKNRRSHRGKALCALMDKLEGFLMQGQVNG